ncbi:uncharacterized protein LAESUDRAFT_75822 [Laetiporus sulphureus 93-53]|uniref:F-box domain-containing protein n=1 Tax=Laetiporus sulphureus 93-53 TaxID=1314785 RepID=A0A165F0M0_9APHY|nr:uncharacterized protein LAESUDRAFT_75822 [Laetiporus sulphureus 93-53]KZT08111.1 hypothetical protein LAESUDRAFT_75822 [Laetiporus sulphureus 93-53]
MEVIKRKLERFGDRMKKWRINLQRLTRIVKGKGKAGPVATRTLPQLPIEVWENVIDHLWDDRDALKACIFVCRAWYSPSRFHLHRQIEIQSVKGVKAYVKELKQTPELSKRAHNMTIDGIWGSDLSSLSTAAILLARKLPRLERLTIRRSEWRPWTMHKDIFLHLSAFSVTRLVLYDVTFPSVTVFGRLICALPCLVELKCTHLIFTHDHFHRDAFGLYCNRVKICSLSIMLKHTAVPDSLIDFLANICISSHLQRCIIRHDPSSEYSPYKGELQRLLNASLGSLSELQFDLELARSERQTDTEMSAADSVLSLNHNISLQRLWLCIWRIPQCSDLDSLCQALLSIKSGQLREVVIAFIYPYRVPRFMEAVKNVLKIHESAYHQNMDKYLSSDPFRTLSKVEFVLVALDVFSKDLEEIAVTAAEEQWKQIFAPLFPRLTKRGIFHATVREHGYKDTF